MRYILLMALVAMTPLTNASGVMLNSDMEVMSLFNDSEVEKVCTFSTYTSDNDRKVGSFQVVVERKVDKEVRLVPGTYLELEECS